MTMNPSDSEPDPLAALAEEFADRCRNGERPSLSEYTRKYPELAERIRRLFPALVVMEEFGAPGGPVTGPYAETVTAPDKTPERLGEYRIVREVGRGGMGVVYEAVQESLGRHVALKVLPAHGLLSPTHPERFRREAQAAARLHHTNIVPVFGVGSDCGVHFYAMQFIQGQSLEAVLHQVRRLRAARQKPARPGARFGEPTPTVVVPVDDAAARESQDETAAPAHSVDSLGSQSLTEYHRSVARLGVQAAEALAYAHAQGVLHRDVKPSNLLLDAHGTLWITDFGLAKVAGAEDLTNTGDVIGTLRYLAPERFRGDADARSDVYSLGLTLYEMLTLRPAFGAEDRAQLIEQVLHRDPPRPRQLEPRLPPDLETIVLKASAREPGQRYSSSAEVVEDLRRFLADQPIRARRVSWLEQARRWRRRNPALAVVGGLAVLFLVAVTALAVTVAILESRNAQESQSHANVLKEERDNVRKEGVRHRLALRQAALFAFYRGHAYCEQGDPGAGLSWITHALETLPGDAQDAEEGGDIEWSIRAHLNAYQRRVGRLERMLPHSGPVQLVAFSPDGKVIFTVSQPRGPAFRARQTEGRFWDAATGEPLGPPFPTGHQVAFAVAFSADGKRLLLGGDGDDNKGWAGVWEVPTGKPLSPDLPHPGGVRKVVFHPDGQTVLTLADVTRRWDIATGQLVGKPIPGHFGGLTPDGKTVLTSANAAANPEHPNPGMIHGAQLWDLDAGKPDSNVLADPRATEAIPIWSVALSPDGKTALSAQWKQSEAANKEAPDGQLVIALWDLVTKRQIGETLRVKHARVAAPVFLSPQTILFPGHGRYRIGRGFECTFSIRPQPPYAISPDGQTLVDGAGVVYDLERGRPIGLPLLHPQPVTAVAFSPDGRHILTGSEDGIARLWEKERGRPEVIVPRAGAQIEGMALSHDGRCLAIKTTTSRGAGEPAVCAVRVVAVDTGGDRFPPIPHPRGVSSVAFRRDGKLLATGAGDGTVQLWDAATGTPHGPGLKLAGSVDRLEFSRDGKALLTMDTIPRGPGPSDDWKWSARLWDPATGEPLGPYLVEKSGGVEGVGFSPDGRVVWLSVGEGGKEGGKGMVKLLEVPSGKVLCSLPHPTTPTVVVFSPDGKVVLTACEERDEGGGKKRNGEAGSAARLWDAATGRELFDLLPHPKEINAAAFHPHGHIVATGSFRNVRLYHVADGKPVSLPRAHDLVDGEHLAFSPDGKVLACGGNNRARVTFWDVTTWKPFADAYPLADQAIEWMAFRPDSGLVTVGDGTVHLRKAPAATPGDVQQTVLGTRVLTGQQVDRFGEVGRLDPEALLSAYEEWRKPGGPREP
jgi:serine/threonine protein kinase/WD40 repeat protein